MNHDDTNRPWYREQMVWLVIAIPATTILGCMLTIYLAITRPDFIVTDAATAAETVKAGTTDGASR